MKEVGWHARFLGLHRAGAPSGSLRTEISTGLLSRPQRTLPASLLYDSRGSELFDAICRTPEYYPTRSELQLLKEVAPLVAERSKAEVLVELGCGMARKTHVLLEALGGGRPNFLYVAVDVSESSLSHVFSTLLPAFPYLWGQAVVGDLRCAPWSEELTRNRRSSDADSQFVNDGKERGKGEVGGEKTSGPRLIAFLGGTLGNFEEDEAVDFLRTLRKRMDPEDWLLLGVDLYKDEAILHRAYNDAQGLTEAFNRNVLRRLQVEFGFGLEEEDFAHESFFRQQESRIEMHLRATRTTRLLNMGWKLDVTVEQGESIRTEISRKPSSSEVVKLIEGAGFVVDEVFLGQPPYALALARC